MFRVEYGSGTAAGQWLGVELRHPPVVFAGRGCGYVGEPPGVGSPVIFVDVERRWGDLAKFAGGGFDRRNALDLKPFDADHSGGRLHRRERSGRPGGTFDIKTGNVQAIRGKRQAGDPPVQMGQPPGRGAGGGW